MENAASAFRFKLHRAIPSAFKDARAGLLRGRSPAAAKRGSEQGGEKKQLRKRNHGEISSRKGMYVYTACMMRRASLPIRAANKNVTLREGPKKEREGAGIGGMLILSNAFAGRLAGGERAASPGRACGCSKPRRPNSPWHCP